MRRIVRPEVAAAAAASSAAAAAAAAAAELEAERAAQQQALLDAWTAEREQLQTTIGARAKRCGKSRTKRKHE